MVKSFLEGTLLPNKVNIISETKINYGISQADMYQVYAYSKKYETPDIWLLYPNNQEMNGRSDISFSGNDGINDSVFFVDVANIEESLKVLRGQLVTGE